MNTNYLYSHKGDSPHLRKYNGSALMRIILVMCCICGLASSPLQAQDVDSSIAAQVAFNYLSYKQDHPVPINDITLLDNTLYRVFFSDGTWCIVSPSKKMPPILAYGESQDIFNDPPQAFLDLIQGYTLQAEVLLEKRESLSDNPLWSKLLHSSKRIPKEYQSPEKLLSSTNKGSMAWGQIKDNNNTCVHPYNKFCPSSSDSTLCYHKRVGCGAVALGMVMWYWQWPPSYSWEEMPGALYSSTGDDQADTVASFLRKCGQLVKMTYWDTGSWTLMDNIYRALRIQGYFSVKQYRASSWRPSAWKNLIRSEIENGRPVIFYGQPSSDFTNGHYFVVDGYEDIGQLFNINFGSNHAGIFCNLENIPKYNDYKHAIVGISPQCNQTMVHSRNYSELPISTWRTEYARQAIYAPNSNNTLTLHLGSAQYLEAGEEVILQEGFEARRGSELTIHINPNLQNGMAIELIQPPYHVSQHSNAWFVSKNADSWEATITTHAQISPSILFQDAGSVRGDTTIIWNHVDLDAGTYYCTLVLKNSYGQRIEEEKLVMTVHAPYSTSFDSISTDASIPLLINDDSDNTDFIISPNPTSGEVQIQLLSSEMLQVAIYNMAGEKVLFFNNILRPVLTLDVSALPQGNYIIECIDSNHSTHSDKLIIR